MNNILCADQDRLNKGRIHFYFMLSNYRLPFVDHQYLIKQLFDLSIEFKNSYEFKQMSVRLLAELILNDVNNEDLFNYLIKTIENLDKKFHAYYRPRDRFNRVVLSKMYLSTFSNVDSEMKIRINNLIDQLIPKIYPEEIRKCKNFGYFNINDKIHKDAFLSNGLGLNTIAIYNKSNGDLVSLDKYLKMFLIDKIDQIPLGEDEEL